MVDKITPDMKAPLSITYGDVFKIYLLFGNLNSILFREQESLWIQIKDQFDPLGVLYDDEFIEESLEDTVACLNSPYSRGRLLLLFDTMFNRNIEEKKQIEEIDKQIAKLQEEKQTLEYIINNPEIGDY